MAHKESYSILGTYNSVPIFLTGNLSLITHYPPPSPQPESHSSLEKISLSK